MPAKKRRKTAKKAAGKRRPKKSSQKQKASTRKRKAKKPKAVEKKAGPPKAQVIGMVTHYFPKVGAAVVKLKKPLAIGDSIVLQGSTTNFQQQVESIEIDHVSIQKAKKGDEIGLQVKDRVREHDFVLIPS